MKKTRVLALLLAIVMLFALLAGCAAKQETAQTEDAAAQQPEAEEPAQEEEPAEEPETAEPAVTLTDMTGREITLDEPATRIVALTPSDCEILYAIGAGDLLVGRGK